jgi:hypothetical protein
MSQSTVVVTSLAAGFVFYLMVKGRLSTYVNLLMGGAGPGTGAAPSTGAPGPFTSVPGPLTSSGQPSLPKSPWALPESIIPWPSFKLPFPAPSPSDNPGAQPAGP